jgi:hypothetical protein
MILSQAIGRESKIVTSMLAGILASGERGPGGEGGEGDGALKNSVGAFLKQSMEVWKVSGFAPRFEQIEGGTV